ncbi:hypothetical protein OOK41_01310 [Micromonospora sp. NBC_01655]|uniref:hypothetical protein n=1 Tax=Micromonospora sp. NBC_01655 TaxID=2975983 RepID=UPI0022539877|nr:hypothetical protein [Micromonospora sp. NBC_01655]MCX4468962.1 hypothetical protein [Micromonospora sp. NBC_01655]
MLYPDDAQVVTERPDLFVDVDLLPPGPTQPVNEPPAVDADPPPTPTQPVDEPPAEDVDQVPPGPTESVDESAPAPTKRARRRG